MSINLHAHALEEEGERDGRRRLSVEDTIVVVSGFFFFFLLLEPLPLSLARTPSPNLKRGRSPESGGPEAHGVSFLIHMCVNHKPANKATTTQGMHS